MPGANFGKQAGETVNFYPMKRLLVLGICLITALSCKKTAVEKPKGLLPPKQMEAILYDITLLKATQNTREKGAGESNYTANLQALYKKHHTDSLRFAQSALYYAAHPKDYLRIYKHVQEHLQTSRQETEAKKQKTLQKKTVPKERELTAPDSAATN